MHRLLSGFPTLALAIAALLAGMYPERARSIPSDFSVWLSDPAAVFISFAFVLIYAALWWASSVEPKSRRQEIREGLRPHLDAMMAAHQKLRTASSIDELRASVENMKPTLAALHIWVRANLISAAAQKLGAPSIMATDYEWRGSHQPDDASWRNKILGLHEARIRILEQAMQSDTWDAEAPNFWSKLRQKMRSGAWI